MQKTTRAIYWVILGVIAYLPFHALISTFFIDLLGSKLPIKGVKELVVLLAVLPLIYVIYRRWQEFKVVKTGLIILIGLYFAVQIVISIFGDGTDLLKAAGLISSLRFFGLFLACYSLARLLPERFKAADKVLKIVVITSVIVVVFGALQVLVLPKDFLMHFGYGPLTILPYGTIDNNQSFVRILSTLRGPNPLGAYLAFIAPLALLWHWFYSKRRSVLIGLIYLATFGVTLYGSQSRGGWLGFVVAIGVYVLLMVKNRRVRIGFVLSGVLLLGVVFALRDSRFISITVLHRDPHGSSVVKSDDARLKSIKRSVNAIEDMPFGHGEGSSGPSSNYGKNPVIIENSYLDVAYQIGWFGALLFIVINVYTGYLLYRTRTRLGYALLAGLVAISINALFWPVWTDETVSMIWWALTGFVLGAPILVKTPKLARVSSDGKAKAKR
jgi:O-antigen ligase